MASSGISFSFAESSPRIRRELRKKELQLQKEFDLMEKQSRTSTNNIANHQQVLKNSWRRLEQRKLEDQLTPLESRTKKRVQPVADRNKRLMFSNRTAICIEKLPSDSNHADNELSSSGSLPHLSEGKSRGSELSSNSKSTHLLPPISPYPTRGHSGSFGNNGDKNGMKSIQRSPFISSPYGFRRPTYPTGTTAGGSNVLQSSSLTRVSNASHPLLKTNNEQSVLKTTDLPSLDASMSTKTRMLSSLSTKRMSKDALLKVGKLLEVSDASVGGGGSRGPESFKKFYESSSTGSSDVNTSNPQIPQFTLNDLEEMSEEEFMKTLTEEEQEQVQTAKEEVNITTIQCNRVNIQLEYTHVHIHVQIR